MPEEIKVRINWQDDDQAAAFANHLIANFDGAVYTLRFFQVLPPALLSFDRDGVQKIESVPGRLLTTLVVTPESLTQILEALTDLVDRMESGKKE